MRSVLDEYLPSEAREQRTGKSPLLNADDIAAVRMKAIIARALPRGLRQDALKRIAREYAISPRTVERYAISRTFSVVINGWEAMFVTSGRDRPRIASGWRRVE